MRLGRLAFFIAIFWGLGSQARVFQLGNEHFATYLRGQYGIAQQKDEAFAPSAGTGTTFDSEYKTNLAYEFGFIYSTQYVNLRFGFEIIKPADLKGVQMKSSGGADWATLTSNISGYAPKLGFEFNLHQWNNTRLFANVDGGYATVTVQNSYTMTPAGTTQFGGLTDFREEVKGTAPLVETALGLETFLSDTTTLALDAGYRNLNVTSFSYSNDVRNFQGFMSKGDAAKNTDGSDRTLNLSGAFASVAIRIWIK